MNDNGDKFYGKYRGMVMSNADPMQKARLLVQVPDVLGPGASSWAMPCAPFAGPQVGVYVLPIEGSGVWVEFEGGDPDYPIWTGGFWSTMAEVPALALTGTPLSPNIVLQTTGQNTVVVSDLPGPTGGIILKSFSGASIIVNDTGIYIQNGKGASITMVSKSVTVNEGALVVM